MGGKAEHRVARLLNRVQGGGMIAVREAATLFGVSEMGHGDSWVHIVVELVIAGVSGFVLVVRQLSRTAPLLPIDLLRIPLFALSVTTSVCAFIGQAIANVSMPFLFEHRFQFDQVMTGLLMTPWPLVVAVIAGRQRDLEVVAHASDARQREPPPQPPGRIAGSSGRRART